MPDSRVAVCSWSLQPQCPADLADRLRSVDLERVQLALSPLIRDPGTWGNAIDSLRNAGFEIVSGMLEMTGEDYSSLQTIARTGGVRPDATWSENQHHAADVAALAAANGIELVTFHAGYIPEAADDPERARLLARLRQIADIFAEHDVQVGLETGQETADTLVEALDQLQRANVGVNFDPANMILYGKGEPVEALRRLAPRVVQLHIKDAVPTDTPETWGREAPVGTGAVDFDGFFAVAASIEKSMDYVIEREAGNARLEDIARARELIVGYLE